MPRCAHNGADTSAAGSVNSEQQSDTSWEGARRHFKGGWQGGCPRRKGVTRIACKQAASALGNMEAPSLPSQEARAAEATAQGRSGMDDGELIRRATTACSVRTGSGNGPVYSDRHLTHSCLGSGKLRDQRGSRVMVALLLRSRPRSIFFFYLKCCFPQLPDCLPCIRAQH